jgi:hypothetical protein
MIKTGKVGKKEKTIAISQSDYIPWKGYFDMINMVDEFVFYDEVQYTKRDWRNRNKIKTPHGLLWLTIPVLTKNKFHQAINEVKVNGMEWKKKHLKSILINYRKAAYFKELQDFVVRLYESANSRFLCEINYSFTKKICDFLGIDTTFKYSFDFKTKGDRTGKIIDLCQQLNATHLVNGPKAKYHLNEELFRHVGIKVSYMDYSGYPGYPQLFPPFEHAVSIVDLILNTGNDAKKFMKSF